MARTMSLNDINLKGKRVLIRVDFNVPLNNQKQILDDTRIVASLPSIEYVLKNGGSVILMSHLGRPKNKPSAEFSLMPCAKRLEELLGRPVKFVSDCIGKEADSACQKANPGDVILLENLRFHPGEENPGTDPSFVKELSKHGDIYINDAFGTAHRAHASTAAIANYFPGKAAAGFLLEKEISFIGDAIANPERPFFALLGGSKISTKLGVIKALLKKVDALFLGGGMVYTFMLAQGLKVGGSIVEESQVNEAKDILDYCEKQKIPLHLPLDLVVADQINANAKIQVVQFSQGIPEGFEGVDIGPKTVESYSKEIKAAKTVLWNGPFGVFEVHPFNKGTEAIAKALAHCHAKVIIGGGETVAAVKEANVAEKIAHISTGGGATLEYLEFGTLPGIEALSKVPS